MHRMGNGNMIATSPAELVIRRKKWFAENRTISTYCTQKEWEEYEEDLGKLVASRDGVELRVGATVKRMTECGTGYRIIHNCLIIGSPGDWVSFPMALRSEKEREFINAASGPATG